MARYGKAASKSVESAMRRRKKRTLKSGSGQTVRSRKQAIAIGLSEAREKGAKVPDRRTGSKRSGGGAKRKRTSAGRSNNAAKRSGKTAKRSGATARRSGTAKRSAGRKSAKRSAKRR
jgi:hypothetical protein